MKLTNITGLPQPIVDAIKADTYSRGEAKARKRFEGKYVPEPTSGCYLWLASVTKGGYGRFGYRKRIWLAHRLAWQFHQGRPIPARMQVLHKCDVPCCVNPDHLYIGTQQDNVDDMCRRGRQMNGEHHLNAKLTAADVRIIRSDRRSTSDLAETFGVSISTIIDIRTGRTWKSVKGRIRQAQQMRGETHPNAKLTAADVRFIRNDRRSSLAIAKDFGVHSSTIRDVRRGQTWKEVQ